MIWTLAFDCYRLLMFKKEKVTISLKSRRKSSDCRKLKEFDPLMTQKQPHMHHCSSLLGTATGRKSPEDGPCFKGASTGGGEEWTDGTTGGGGGKRQRAEPTDPNSQPAGKSEGRSDFIYLLNCCFRKISVNIFHKITEVLSFRQSVLNVKFSVYIYDLRMHPVSVLLLQLTELRKQSEEVNSAVEAGDEIRRKLQRELDSAIQRERQKEEEKERVERQRERLREEIEDMTIALQRERQNCTALEKRQKKFDQVRNIPLLLTYAQRLQMSLCTVTLPP